MAVLPASFLPTRQSTCSTSNSVESSTLLKFVTCTFVSRMLAAFSLLLLSHERRILSRTLTEMLLSRSRTGYCEFNEHAAVSLAQSEASQASGCHQKAEAATRP